jgi:hypothetical protein
MLQRTIRPKEECLFYIALVFQVPDNGAVLFYRISILWQLDSALIPCGQIVFKK